jgi:hypothetical protein
MHMVIAASILVALNVIFAVLLYVNQSGVRRRARSIRWFAHPYSQMHPKQHC